MGNPEATFGDQPCRHHRAVTRWHPGAYSRIGWTLGPWHPFPLEDSVIPRAPFITSVQFGTKAGGVGPFVVVATVLARIVPYVRIVDSVLPMSRVVNYIEWNGFLASAGNSGSPMAQTYTKGYQTANRYRITASPAVVWCVLQVTLVTPVIGLAYRRAFGCVDPP